MRRKYKYKYNMIYDVIEMKKKEMKNVSNMFKMKNNSHIIILWVKSKYIILNLDFTSSAIFYIGLIKVERF